MTSVDMRDMLTDEMVSMDEVYKIPAESAKGESLSAFIADKEEAMVERIKESGRYEPIKVKSELISKRRYKRKLAKEIKRRSKRID